MAWNNASSQKCKAAYDVLCKIKHAGVKFPNEQEPDNFLESTAGEILDFSQRVFKDNKLWNQMPVTFNVRGVSINSDELHSWLGKVINESR